MIKLDGGLSTALENNGNNLNTSLWTGELLLSNPGEITKAHLDFINAGVTNNHYLRLSTLICWLPKTWLE